MRARDDAPGVALLENANRIRDVFAGNRPAVLECAPADLQRVGNRIHIDVGVCLQVLA